MKTIKIILLSFCFAFGMLSYTNKAEATIKTCYDQLTNGTYTLITWCLDCRGKRADSGQLPSTCGSGNPT